MGNGEGKNSAGPGFPFGFAHSLCRHFAFSSAFAGSFRTAVRVGAGQGISLSPVNLS
jgi:hypothetical protein